MLARDMRGEAAMAAAGEGGRTVYFEHVVLGRQVKCSAIDGATGVEVSVFGPANAAQRDLETIALRKLRARLAADRPPARSSTEPGGGSPGGGSSRLV